MLRVPPEPAPVASGSGETVGLLGLSGAVEGQLYQLAEGRVSIGRSPECDIHIDEGSISKRHAELRVQPGNCRIHGVSSSNGVFVNGNAVDDVALNPGDVIRLGRIEMMFDSHERLLGNSPAGGGLPPWAWMIVGFVGAGAILAVAAWFVL
jgi:pSer/pThr/pTyr-binding forkhead associated (FHA) protein